MSEILDAQPKFSEIKKLRCLQCKSTFEYDIAGEAKLQCPYCKPEPEYKQAGVTEDEGVSMLWYGDYLLGAAKDPKGIFRKAAKQLNDCIVHYDERIKIDTEGMDAAHKAWKVRQRGAE